jgi:hypothetical protein
MALMPEAIADATRSLTAAHQLATGTYLGEGADVRRVPVMLLRAANIGQDDPGHLTDGLVAMLRADSGRVLGGTQASGVDDHITQALRWLETAGDPGATPFRLTDDVVDGASRVDPPRPDYSTWGPQREASVRTAELPVVTDVFGQPIPPDQLSGVDTTRLVKARQTRKGLVYSLSGAGGEVEYYGPAGLTEEKARKLLGDGPPKSFYRRGMVWAPEGMNAPSAWDAVQAGRRG